MHEYFGNGKDFLSRTSWDCNLSSFFGHLNKYIYAIVNLYPQYLITLHWKQNNDDEEGRLQLHSMSFSKHDSLEALGGQFDVDVTKPINFDRHWACCFISEKKIYRMK